jgi:hypothetical protein
MYTYVTFLWIPVASEDHVVWIRGDFLERINHFGTVHNLMSVMQEIVVTTIQFSWRTANLGLVSIKYKTSY